MRRSFDWSTRLVLRARCCWVSSIEAEGENTEEEREEVDEGEVERRKGLGTDFEGEPPIVFPIPCPIPETGEMEMGEDGGI